MRFDGFPPGNNETIKLHARFFSDVMPQIDDLATLKLCLFCYYALYQKSGRYRYLHRGDFSDNPEFMAGLPADDAAAALDHALAQAVELRFLLAVDVLQDGATVRYYFVNTPRGKQAIAAIQNGQWLPDRDDDTAILPERPTVYALYEDNIGALTPGIAERLRDAEAEYGYAWVAEAIDRALENNVRRWTYIDAILKRWKTEGRDEAITQATVTQAYRENIDPRLGPMIREKLDDAERQYPEQWIIDAIMLAVENNAKNWRYIRAILERWQSDGRQNEKPRRDSEKDNPFAGLKWSDFTD